MSKKISYSAAINQAIDEEMKENKTVFVIGGETKMFGSLDGLEKKYGTNKNVYHQFMPYDFVLLINNFFKNWKPDIATFVDSEIWPNFILKVKSLNIPLILLNARITKKSFNRWKMFRKTSNKIFKSFNIGKKAFLNSSCEFSFFKEFCLFLKIGKCHFIFLYKSKVQTS